MEATHRALMSLSPRPSHTERLFPQQNVIFIAVIYSHVPGSDWMCVGMLAPLLRMFLNQLGFTNPAYDLVLEGAAN